VNSSPLFFGALSGPNVDIVVGNPLDGLVGGAVGSFLTTAAVGAILVAVAPEYTDRLTDRVVASPVDSFVYGLASLVFLLFATFLLVVTIVGILVAIPLALLSYLAWALGSTIAFLAIGDRLVGREDGWGKPLVVGAGISGALALTGVGALVSFGVGAAGFGAVLLDWLG
jgi:hypothetical protein